MIEALAIVAVKKNKEMEEIVDGVQIRRKNHRHAFSSQLTV